MIIFVNNTVIILISQYRLFRFCFEVRSYFSGFMYSRGCFKEHLSLFMVNTGHVSSYTKIPRLDPFWGTIYPFNFYSSSAKPVWEYNELIKQNTLKT